jgi:dipeptidase E
MEVFCGKRLVDTRHNSVKKVKVLLTSGGIKNPTIKQALVDLLGKPIQACQALLITTASFGFDQGFERAYEFIHNDAETPMGSLGWKACGLVDIAALSILTYPEILKRFSQWDVLLVNGGDPMFLAYWFEQMNLKQLLHDWNGVYVGLSAGSMVLTPRIGMDFVGWTSPLQSDETLGLVPFSIFPHLNHPQLTENTLANAEKWFSALPLKEAYFVDDQTAISWYQGKVEIHSEGEWFVRRKEE